MVRKNKVREYEKREKAIKYLKMVLSNKFSHYIVLYFRSGKAHDLNFRQRNTNTRLDILFD